MSVAWQEYPAQSDVPELMDSIVDRRASSPDVAVWRLYCLRFIYLVMALGIAVTFWPAVLHHTTDLAERRGVQLALLSGLGLMAALGLRYPVKMIPVVLFEFAWKVIYLLGFSLPAWRAGALSEQMHGDLSAVAAIAMFLPFVPWRYVWREFVTAPGDRWR